jgi:hypothetical protein
MSNLVWSINPQWGLILALKDLPWIQKGLSPFKSLIQLD